MVSIDLHQHRSAIFPDSRLHRQLVDVGLEILLTLPAIAIEALPEISLAIKKTYADQRDAEIGSAFDVISGQHSESAGINRKRLVHSKFSGEIGHRPRTQHPSVTRSPGSFRILIFTKAAICVVDPAVQDQFGRTRLEFG